MPALPSRARVVVIGGGVIGTSVAYHLAHLGEDVLLLERDRLTSGTTWHAAGLMVTFGSTSETSTQMRTYTRDLYTRLESETGLSTGFKPVGFVEVAADHDRLEEYRRVASFNRLCGVDVHEISPREVGDLFPMARTDDLLAGFYVAEDGRANPVDVTMSLAKGARQVGATILEGVPVQCALTRDGAVAGVRTGSGEAAQDIECEVVVNCAGMWARQLAERNGVTVPLQAAEHYYLLTEPIPGVSPDWPVLEDPGRYGYFREEGGGLMLGLFEAVCAPWRVEGVPEDFSFGVLPPDWERMSPYLEAAMGRIPASADAGIRKLFCGPESFTPDLAPIVGEAPELRNYFVAAGMNSIGILTGGGLGRVLAHWITEGRPDVDVTAMNIDRVHPYQATAQYRRTRTVESLGMVYQCHYPTRSMATARGARLTPWHDRLAAAGARFREVSGWESPEWYGEEPDPDPGPLSWGRPAWFDRWAAEHRAVRECVAAMDMSFMAKFLVTGPDSGAFLGWLSANSVDGDPGVLTYTQWLNADGRIEADVTVTKLEEETFWVVASDTAERHVETWLRRHVGDRYVQIRNVTSAYAQLNVQGPASRAVLAAATSADLDAEAFPFRGARWVDLGAARALCTRVTYVGELGYELYVPVEQAVSVYDRVLAAGKEQGIVHAGLRALSSLRLEKAYRDYGHDIDNTDSVLQAGLSFAVDPSHDFLGRDAVLDEKERGPLQRRLLSVLLEDPEPLMWHAEPLLRNDVPVGYLRAASYGHTLGGAVGLAMADAGEPLDKAWIEAGTWTVEVAGRRWPAGVSLRPLYDPSSSRVRD